MAKDSGVFFVRGNNMIRVVKTNDLQKRFSEWQAASPYPLTIVGKITTAATAKVVGEWLQNVGLLPRMGGMTDNWRGNECDIMQAHDFLKIALHRFRVRGEWYDLNQAILATVPCERF